MWPIHFCGLSMKLVRTNYPCWSEVDNSLWDMARRNVRSMDGVFDRSDVFRSYERLAHLLSCSHMDHDLRHAVGVQRNSRNGLGCRSYEGRIGRWPKNLLLFYVEIVAIVKTVLLLVRTNKNIGLFGTAFSVKRLITPISTDLPRV